MLQIVSLREILRLAPVVALFLADCYRTVFLPYLCWYIRNRWSGREGSTLR